MKVNLSGMLMCKHCNLTSELVYFSFGMFRNGSLGKFVLYPAFSLWCTLSVMHRLIDHKTFSLAGYFRPPPPNNMGFQVAPTNNLPAGAPIPGEFAL